MKFSIIVFKHGSIHSRQNILAGWLNLPLSFVGEKQAELLAVKLKHERISVAFCSDLLRSKQTLASVLAFHPHARVVVDHRLRERHLGVINDSFEEVFTRTAKKDLNIAHKDYYLEVDGGENLHLVSKRVFPFMNDVLRFIKKEKVNVAICAHPESFKLICEFLEGFDHFQTSRILFDPTKYKKFVIDFE